MAQDTRRSREAAAASQDNGADAEERAATRRVVLKRERVIVLPDDVDTAALTSGDGAKKLADALGLKSAKVPTSSIGVEAWAVVGEFEGQSKNAAIEAYAGKAGTPDAKPGAYKAPSVSAFAGGLIYERPPEPKVERRSLD